MGTGSCLVVEEGTTMEWELIVPSRRGMGCKLFPGRNSEENKSISKTVVSLNLLEEQVREKKTEEGWRRAVLIYLRIRLVRECSA